MSFFNSRAARVIVATSLSFTALFGHAQDNNDFNPNISITLDGLYTSYDSDFEEYELSGFDLAGEASELPVDGFGIGHTELTLSGNIDANFFGQLTTAIAEHDGATELELEEAFIETLGLGNGITVRAGRFLSGVGYLNQQHAHAWDFADAPLVYRGLWGNHYIDDGVRASWVAPTELYTEIGAEIFAGNSFPAGGSDDIGSTVLFANIGGDISTNSSWQLGVSHQFSDLDGRTVDSHAHEEEHDEEGEEGEEEEDHDEHEEEGFTGESETTGIGFVYKWAPNGNYKDRHFKLQGEYFVRDESSDHHEEEHDEEEEDEEHEEHEEAGDYSQSGFYVQAFYQFAPQWSTAVRFDQLESDLAEEDPSRVSAMVAWAPSEFSRVRLQFNRDDSHEEADNQIMLQYTMSLGAHGAHSF